MQVDVKGIIQRQYLSALAMLRAAVEQCPNSQWNAAGEKNLFWHLAYHALSYTHSYLQDNEQSFTPWKKHQKDSSFLDKLPWPPFERVNIQKPYTRAEVLEYEDFCEAEVRRRVPEMDLEDDSGFSWNPMTKLEHHLVNIRHIQHHAAQLGDRQRNAAGIGVERVGSK